MLNRIRSYLSKIKQKIKAILKYIRSRIFEWGLIITFYLIITPFAMYRKFMVRKKFQDNKSVYSGWRTVNISTDDKSIYLTGF